MVQPAHGSTPPAAPVEGASAGGPDTYFEDALLAPLRESCLHGGLKGVVVCTAEGLPLASTDSEFEAEMLAGLASLFEDIARRSEALLGWPWVEEVTLVNDRGQRLVTRQFQVDERWFILVALVAARRPYRRATNRAVRQLIPLLGRWQQEVP